MRIKMDTLSIPSVLQTVLKHLDTNIISRCRLVNKAWNYEACKLLKNEVTISFGTRTHLRRFIETFESSIPNVSIQFHQFNFQSVLLTSAVEEIVFGNLTRLQDDLQRLVHLVDNQLTTLKLCIFPLLPVVGNPGEPYTNVMYTESLKMIYKHFPNIQHLKLLFLPSLSTPSSTPASTEMLETAINHDYTGAILPNLTSLQVDACILSSRNDDYDYLTMGQVEADMVQKFINGLLISAVNLQSISWKSTNSDIHKPLPQHFLINSMHLISSIPCLKEIDVELPLTSEESPLCAQEFSTLNSVHLLIHEIDPTEVSGLQPFLLRCGPTIRKLHLEFYEPSSQLSLGFPLKNLSYLTLEQFKGSLNWGKLPALKTLVLQRCSFKGIALSLLAAPLKCNLCNLQIVNGSLDCKETFVRFFVETAPYCFPQLNTLVITNFLYVLPLGVIFKECKQLKHLTVLKCSGVTDEVLCGIRKKLLQIVCPVEILARDATMADISKAVVPLAREFPFIGDLSGLQSLTMEGEFSDVSILYGIILCQKLKRLSLKFDMCTWRSPSIIKVALTDLVCATLNGNKL